MGLTPKQIKDWRIKQEMTQQDLATILGISVVTVARWERDDVITNPTGTSEMILEALILKDGFIRCARLYFMLKDVFE